MTSDGVEVWTRRASRVQDAVRILLLLDHCAEPDTECTAHPDAAAVLRAQKELQALDFWLRNPDYLADELLNAAEAGRSLPDVSPVDRAAVLLDGDEPDLSWYDERAALVLLLAGGRSGSALKELQYAQGEYERTHMGEDIAGIP